LYGLFCESHRQNLFIEYIYSPLIFSILSMYPPNGLGDNNTTRILLSLESTELVVEYMSMILSQLKSKKIKHQQLFVQYVVWSIVRNVVNY
jgi:hypothetical protein